MWTSMWNGQVLNVRIITLSDTYATLIKDVKWNDDNMSYYKYESTG